ncbi:MAG: PEP-CTERM sorting domain-containing protein [Pirellulales bacterium]
MTTRNHIAHQTQHRFAPLAVVLLMGLVASNARAATTGNLLSDPSFEANPLISYFDILLPPFTSGAWGAESATITGSANGISPADGSLMLSMTNDGLIATQAWQTIDVSAYSTPINAGLVTVDASALYNVPADIATGLSSLNIQFLNALHIAIGAGANVGSPVLDSNVSTWEQLSITGAFVPSGTQFIRAQVAYNNASLMGAGAIRPGYVDDAHLTLTIVPEPATLIPLSIAVVGGLLFHKRRRSR